MRRSQSTRIRSHRTEVLGKRAAEMRRAPTASEARLFEAVRGGRLGVSFRRQVPPLERFVANLFAYVNSDLRIQALPNPIHEASDHERMPANCGLRARPLRNRRWAWIGHRCVHLTRGNR